MPSWIKPERVRQAGENLRNWRREKAHSQNAMHLFPLLALIWKGATSERSIPYSEEIDHEFWKKFCAVAGELDKPYVDPLVGVFQPADYPHRSPATIRKRTFINAWHAAELKGNPETIKLASGYVDIFVAKALTRSKRVTKIPLIDLTVWLYREHKFPDDAGVNDLRDQFRRDFSFPDGEFDKLFS
jgi:hypothetical protein